MNFHERFKILAVLHYVFAGMMALFGFFPLLYVFIGVMIYLEAAGSNTPNGPPPEFGLLFVAIGSLGSIFVWAMAAAIAMCGYYLHVQKRYLFCMVVAAIETMNMPVGTGLGVFTIVSLADPKGRAMFEPPDTPRPNDDIAEEATILP